jgi:hypothetical protein
MAVYSRVRRSLAEGVSGLADPSSRPHTLARLTPEPIVTRIVALRLALRTGPVQLAAQVGLPTTTVGVVLRREQLPRLAVLDQSGVEPNQRRGRRCLSRVALRLVNTDGGLSHGHGQVRPGQCLLAQQEGATCSFVPVVPVAMNSSET